MDSQSAKTIIVRWVLLVVFASSALSAHAAEKATVEELRQILAQQQADHLSDYQAAAQIGSLELTEQLTDGF